MGEKNFESSGCIEELSWNNLVYHYFQDHLLDGEKILPNYRQCLPLKDISSQREKTSILQDMISILRGEKSLIRPLVQAGKKHSEALKKRSVAIFIAKQLYNQSQSSLRLVKR